MRQGGRGEGEIVQRRKNGSGSRPSKKKLQRDKLRRVGKRTRGSRRKGGEAKMKGSDRGIEKQADKHQTSLIQMTAYLCGASAGSRPRPRGRDGKELVARRREKGQ